MHLSDHRRESSRRVVFPPVVVVALVWVGLQILLHVYFRVVLLYPTEPVPSLAEFMAQVLAGSSTAGPALATVLFVVNILFVGLIWLKYRSLQSPSPPEKLTAMLTYGGASVLLLYLQWKWLELLRSAFQ